MISKLLINVIIWLPMGNKKKLFEFNDFIGIWNV